MRRYLPVCFLLLTGCGRELSGPIAAPPQFVQAQLLGGRLVLLTEKKVILETIWKDCHYTVSRTAKGAYVDASGQGHDCEGPGRRFVEGALIKPNALHQISKVLQEQHCKKVSYTVSRVVGSGELALDEQRYELYYADGEVIPRTRWPERLRTRTPVLHTERFDLYYTRLMQSDTLVLVGPALPAAAPQVVRPLGVWQPGTIPPPGK